MPGATVEMAREVMKALSDREFERLTSLTSNDVEWRSFFAELGEGGVYRGHEGMIEYAHDLRDAWGLVRAEVDQGLAVGDVAVLVGRIHYRGKASGIEAEDPAGWVLRFHDGLVISFRAFRDPEGALAALGAD